MELEEAIESLTPGVLRYCLAVTGNRAQAEDVSQEALAALVVRWRRHGPPDAAAAFVFAIARRRARRAVVKNRLLAPAKWLLNGHAREPSAHDRVEDRQRLAHTLAAMKRLTEAERQGLELVVIGGLPTREAAGLLGVSAAALKMRIHRARRRLTELLEERDD